MKARLDHMMRIRGSRMEDNWIQNTLSLFSPTVDQRLDVNQCLRVTPKCCQILKKFCDPVQRSKFLKNLKTFGVFL